MMQELSAGLRQAGVNIFRHRRGMLFVSPIRARIFSHESAGVSASINAILEKVAATPGINRKRLAEQLAPAEAEPADHERAKMTLASDLRWLVSEGYVIEFNDGSLDLPKTKPPIATVVEAVEKPADVIEAPSTEAPAEVKPVEEKPAEAAVLAADEMPAPVSVKGEEPPYSG
jgi:hypothetical protein